ncbi:ABC transporter permease [Arsenicicoccus piscis]|uniref:Peptide ABC transporter permease n=1 Tax=Arsenicicoccus piscis TaxID=673954 RepID=A0ABQ6HLS9_9MICO|nr:ABC transporter permease [Arsenicicoccus piscis]MCH8628188.1 ABC transporter permease [Arsenicicoccus piscis]GMA18424.1 peptide ABC transporter permease [Arsenicicoccus piscis]
MSSDHDPIKPAAGVSEMGMSGSAGAVELAEDEIQGAEARGEILGRTQRQIAWARFKRDKVSMAALVGSIIVVLLAVIAPLLEAVGLTNTTQGNPALVPEEGSLPSGAFGGMSTSHWLGVQPGSGKDLLSLILAGMTTSLQVAVFATAIAIVLGTLFGLIAGFAGGKIDWLISRFMDLVLSFPQVLMLLSLQLVLVAIIANVMGMSEAAPWPKKLFMIIVLGFFGWPYFARIIRGQVMSLRQREFVEAARSLGAKNGRLYLKELLPHLWAPILVYTSLILPQNISAEAALGFLGVGLNPPAVSLGSILNDSVVYAPSDPAYFLFPGGTVFLMVLAFNLLGDGLRDALDPKADRQ